MFWRKKCYPAFSTRPRVFHQIPHFPPCPAFSTPHVFHTPGPHKHTRGPWPHVFHQASLAETAKTSKNLNKPKKKLFSLSNSFLSKLRSLKSPKQSAVLRMCFYNSIETDRTSTDASLWLVFPNISCSPILPLVFP